MVFHLLSHSQRNMFRQTIRLFPLQSNRYSFLGNSVSASAYNAIPCYSKGVAIRNHAFKRVLVGACVSIQGSVVKATSRA